MEQRGGSSRPWACAADLLVLVTLLAALTRATSGPITVVASVPSTPWLLLFAAIVLLVRHRVAPRPTILARLAALLATPRAIALSVGVAATVFLLGMAAAQALQRAAEDRAGVTYTVLRELEPTPLRNCRL